jgi:hypothetical protein
MTPKVLLNRRTRTAVLDRWSDVTAGASLDRAYEAEAARVRATYGGAPAISRFALVGYRVRRPGPRAATVAIWAVALAAGRTGTGASGRSTLAVGLRSRDARWRIASVTAVPGPAPTDDARELARAAASFHPFRHER